jgi:hypothetical protein
MNNVLKWILYILLGVVVLAIIAGIVFAFLGPMNYAYMHPGIRMFGPYGFSYRMGVSPLRAIFGGLLGLGLIILIIVGIVALVNAIVRSNRRSTYVQPAQPVAPAQPAAAMPSRTCPNCGKPAMEDWKNCPYCGTLLT